MKFTVVALFLLGSGSAIKTAKIQQNMLRSSVQQISEIQRKIEQQKDSAGTNTTEGDATEYKTCKDCTKTYCSYGKYMEKEDICAMCACVRVERTSRRAQPH